ncbi:hypothetical protein BJV82DRAFT_624908 [Fennellomyces sp. T-0311]|nr:hypothetical protein BJV82DRAFT_624908 [Fennellomyces sp. T-0311]
MWCSLPFHWSKSRYTEQFDLIPPPELLEALSNEDTTRPPKKPSSTHKTLRPFLTSSNSSSTIEQLQPSPSTSTSRPPLANATFWSSSSISRSFTTRNQSNHKLSDLSENEEHVVSKPAKKKKSKIFGSSSSNTKDDKKDVKTDEEQYAKPSGPRVPTIFSLNRAEVIITRLDNWQHLLKAVINWMEELVKISFQNSRCFSQRALPVLKEDIGETSSENAMATVQAGLQMLSIQLATEQKEFGKKIQQDFLPGLIKLRKDSKEMIRGLKEEPELVMDELLRLAETTRKSMTVLNRHCKAAESYPVEHDPWLSNLYVLRQLKREVDEENRMRKLMVPIQKGTAAFEARVMEQLKPAIEFCYQKLAPNLWNGSEENDTPFKLVMEEIMPTDEWKSFYESKKKDLVNEENPEKDYLKINYPNKLNPKVMTVAKGVLERRHGVLKQYTERYFVLSQCGYLHQFTMDDKVSPERSIYIPETTIVPGIDISHFADDDKTEGPFTFEIHKRGTQVLQRDRTFYFRTNTREELLSWCRMLCDVSSAAQGIQLISPPIQYKPDSASSSSSSDDHHRFFKNGSTISVPTVRSIHSNLTATSPAPSAQPKPSTSANGATTPTVAANSITAAAEAKAAATAIASALASNASSANQSSEKTEIDDFAEKTAVDAAGSPVSDNARDHNNVDITSNDASKNDTGPAPVSNGVSSATPTATSRETNGVAAKRETTDTITPPVSTVTAAAAAATVTAAMAANNDINGTVDDTDDDDDDDASVITARAVPQASEDEQSRYDISRPESRASTVDDSESSVYFSSTSGPPSPTSSTASLPRIENITIPALEDGYDDDGPSTPRQQIYQPMLNFSI